MLLRFQQRRYHDPNCPLLSQKVDTYQRCPASQILALLTKGHRVCKCIYFLNAPVIGNYMHCLRRGLNYIERATVNWDEDRHSIEHFPLARLERSCGPFFLEESVQLGTLPYTSVEATRMEATIQSNKIFPNAYI